MSFFIEASTGVDGLLMSFDVNCSLFIDLNFSFMASCGITLRITAKKITPNFRVLFDKGSRLRYNFIGFIF